MSTRCNVLCTGSGPPGAPEQRGSTNRVILSNTTKARNRSGEIACSEVESNFMPKMDGEAFLYAFTIFESNLVKSKMRMGSPLLSRRPTHSGYFTMGIRQRPSRNGRKVFPWIWWTLTSFLLSSKSSMSIRLEKPKTSLAFRVTWES